LIEENVQNSEKIVLAPTLPVPEALSTGVKRPGREVNKSPATSIEVKNTWIYKSTPPYVFMA
jgi:hypothetical protein